MKPSLLSLPERQMHRCTRYTRYMRYTRSQPRVQTPTKVDGDAVHSCGGAGVSRAGSGEHKRLSTHVHTRLLELDGRLVDVLHADAT